jgi:hypothetical protein
MKLFDWISRRQATSPQKILDRMERLRHEGRSAEGLRLIESAAGIDPEDYTNPSRALQKIRQWAADADSESAYLIIGRWLMLLADTPGPEDRLPLVARLWELDSGLSAEDYSDPERLRAHIRERVEGAGLDSRFYVFHAGQLAAALGVARRTLEELAVLEAVLGLDQRSYSDPQELARILRLQSEGNVPDLRAFPIPALIGALNKLGRSFESSAVLVAALGLTQQDFMEPTKILTKTLEAVGEPRLALLFLLLLPSKVREAGGGGAGLIALEIHLDPDPERYSSISRLVSRLRERLHGWPPDIRFFYLQALVVGLTDEGRIGDAIALLAADIGLASMNEFADPERIAARLKERCRAFPANVDSFYVWLVSYVLVLAGHPLTAAAVIEIDTGLQAVDWNDATALARTLETRLIGLSVISPLFLVDQLASALAEGGYEDRAALLVDAYVRALSPTRGADEDISLVRWRCQMYARWLFWWGQDESRQPMEVCQSLLPYLRRSIAGRGTTLQDREIFVRGVGKLRRHIVQTGLYWAARETDPVRAKELQQTVLLWDLELAQRLLVERFLLSEISSVPAGEPPMTGAWPLQRHEEPHTPGYLPPAGEVLAAVCVLDKSEPFS